MVYKAQASCPEALVNPAGAIALRFPVLNPSHSWLYECIARTGVPLPSTSVNLSGQAPRRTWQEAVAFAQAHQVYVPTFPPHVPTPIHADQPSTVLEILGHDRYRILRSGGAWATPEQKIREGAWEQRFAARGFYAVLPPAFE